ncbi:hypothetical protein BGZ98_009348 [Dissophora globulifera]|nr:hypothetical protein BGZ98_009348 [Dissophora globulifera]
MASRHLDLCIRDWRQDSILHLPSVLWRTSSRHHLLQQRAQIIAQRGENESSWLIKRALGVYFFAVSIWLVDLHLCEFVNGVGPNSILKWNPQFHAWWHVFSIVGVYFTTLLVAYQHYIARGLKPAVYLWRGVAPALTLDAAAQIKSIKKKI